MHNPSAACTHFSPLLLAGWWFKPDFIINELNINSAVARPWHDEVVPLATNKPYEVNGYAYTGAHTLQLTDSKSGRMLLVSAASECEAKHTPQQPAWPAWVLGLGCCAADMLAAGNKMGCT